MVTVCSVESFDVGILGRFPWLYIFKFNGVHFTPFGSEICYEFRPVIHSNSFRFLPVCYKMIQYPYHSAAFNGVIYFDMDYFSVVIINNIKALKLSSVIQSIMHKINAPCMIQVLWNFQGLLYSGR